MQHVLHWYNTHFVIVWITLAMIMTGMTCSFRNTIHINQVISMVKQRQFTWCIAHCNSKVVYRCWPYCCQPFLHLQGFEAANLYAELTILWLLGMGEPALQRRPEQDIDDRRKKISYKMKDGGQDMLQVSYTQNTGSVLFTRLPTVWMLSQVCISVWVWDLHT